MQASFIGWRVGDAEVLLVCSRDVLAPVLKRLSMFVLRAKARLTDATADFALWGLAGDAVAAVAGEALPPWSRQDTPGHRGAPLSRRRAGARPAGATHGPACPVRPGPGARPLGVGRSAEWRGHADGAAGRIVRAADAQLRIGGRREFQEGLLPRPGGGGAQPVPRHAQAPHLPGACPEAITVGAEVFAASDAEQPCGTVVQAAAAPGGGFDALVALQVASTGEALRVGGPEGVPSPWATCPTRCSTIFDAALIFRLPERAPCERCPIPQRPFRQRAAGNHASGRRGTGSARPPASSPSARQRERRGSGVSRSGDVTSEMLMFTWGRPASS